MSGYIIQIKKMLSLGLPVRSQVIWVKGLDMSKWVCLWMVMTQELAGERNQKKKKKERRERKEGKKTGRKEERTIKDFAFRRKRISNQSQTLQE